MTATNSFFGRWYIGDSCYEQRLAILNGSDTVSDQALFARYVTRHYPTATFDSIERKTRVKVFPLTICSPFGDIVTQDNVDICISCGGSIHAVEPSVYVCDSCGESFQTKEELIYGTAST